MKAPAATILLAFAAAACTAFGPQAVDSPVAVVGPQPIPSPPPVPSPQAHDALVVSEIVAEAVEAMRSPPAERRRRLAQAEQALAQQPAAAARLRLATLLATLPPPLRDDARAAALLDSLRSGATQTPIARLAALIATQLAERRQLVQAGVRREDALRRQVEALRAIERGISAREESLSQEPR